MNNFRYILQPYSGRNSRFSCPECGKNNQFTKYIDLETGKFLADHVGICNRVNNCGYHYTPKQYFETNGFPSELSRPFIPKPKQINLPTSYIDPDIFKKTLQGYERNNLVKYLNSLFDPDKVDHLINIYKIGTSMRYEGGTTVFWQIDMSDNIRTGKLVKYDDKGHRVHGKQNWVHSVLNIDNYNLNQCLFGEHVLKYDTDATVGIVESEKSAVIASGYFPDLIWLASGGSQGINIKKVKVVLDRNVILFPDASPDGNIYDKWKEKADQFGFKISDYLEQYTTNEQKTKGVDIADFL